MDVASSLIKSLKIYSETFNVFTLEHCNIAVEYLNNSSYTFRWLEESELKRYVSDSRYDLYQHLSRSLANKDICFGVFDGQMLAGYSWYSNSPTHITGEFRAVFSQKYKYMHHLFIREDYRGRRLNAFNIAKAIKDMHKQASTDLICVVSKTNNASMKSLTRLGFQQVGQSYVIGKFNTCIIHTSESCKDIFRIEPHNTTFNVLEI